MTDARPDWGRTALIGSTGFVGGVLAQHIAFDAAYASANLDQIADQTFDTVICAGAPAAMWRANMDPVGDLANLERLVENVGRGRIGRVVLISTIAVLANPTSSADEATDDFETRLAYGRNRRWLETALADRFSTLILRLPALFGPGLKKNFLFDLRHPVPSFLRKEAFRVLQGQLSDRHAASLRAVYAPDGATGLMMLDRSALMDRHDSLDLAQAVVAAGYGAADLTHPDSRFQFYGLDHLATDIAAALELDLDVLHLAVEPWRAGDLCEALTGRSLTMTQVPSRSEDMRTRYAERLGGSGPYLQTRDQVLQAIRHQWQARAW